jgi:hypothetical protein
VRTCQECGPKRQKRKSAKAPEPAKAPGVLGAQSFEDWEINMQKEFLDFYKRKLYEKEKELQQLGKKP